MTTATIQEYEDIRTIRQQWLSLDSIAGERQLPYVCYTYYQTYEWNEFLYDMILRGMGRCKERMLYAVVSKGGAAVAILPMVITRSSGKVRIPSCRVAGVLNMSCPYSGQELGETMDVVSRYLESKSHGSKFSLADIPCRTPLASIIKGMGGHYSERTSYHVPLCDFSSFDAYLSSLSKNIYKNIRKSYNHLTSDNRLMQLKVYGSANMPDDSYLRTIWTLYFRRKQAWRGRSAAGWLAAVGIAVKAWREVRGGCAMQSVRQLPSARLYVLEIDTQPAAFMIVYKHRNHLLMPKLAIDSSYSRYSPGILMIMEAVKEWLNEGIVDFDLCRGDERYKKEVGGINEPLCRIDK